jgi:Flp pilus assembly protein TadG
MHGRRSRHDGGATAVEFALIMLPLLYIVFGIIQYGIYFYAMQTGTSAVGEAARRLTVGNCQDSTQLEQFLHDRLGAASTTPAADLNPTVVYKSAASPPSTVSAPGEVGGSVEITVTFSTINMHFPFIPLPDGGHVTRTVFGRVEDTASLTNGCT